MSDFASDLTNTPTPATGAPAEPAATPTPVPAVVATATPLATPQAPAIGAPPVEPSWLKGRLDETRSTTMRQAEQYYAQQMAQREAAYKAQLDQVQTQLRALVGVTPPANPEIDAVRQQFGQLYPGLSRIEERANEIMEVLERAGDLESQTNHYWTAHGRNTINRLFEKASESLGAPLTEDGRRQLHSAFSGYVASSPELTDRYANDPTLVDDFWKAFTSSFVEPVRRASSAAVIDRTRTPLPANAPSGSPTIQQAPKPDGLDQRAAQGWAMYQHAIQRNK